MLSNQKRLARSTLIGLGIVSVVYIVLALAFAVQGGAYWAAEQGYNRIATEGVRLFPISLSANYPGQRLDADFDFLPFESDAYRELQGRPFLIGSPIFWTFSQPFVSVFGEMGVLVVPLLSGLASLWLLLYLLNAFVPTNWVWVGLVLAGLATPLLIYSLSYSEHSLATALLLAGLVPLVTNPDEERWNTWILSAIVCGMAVVIRKEMLWLTAALGIYLIISQPKHWKQWLVWGSVIVSILGLEALGNYMSFGQPIPLEYWFSVRWVGLQQLFIPQQGIDGYANSVIDASRFGVALLAVAGVYCLSTWIPSARWRELVQTLALTIFGAGAAIIVFGRPPSAGLNGFLSVAPFLLLGLRWPRAESRPFRNYYFLLLGALIVSVIIRGGFAIFDPPPEGLQWGSRNMLAIFMLAIPLVVANLSALRHQAQGSRLAKLHFAAALGMCVLGFAVQSRGLMLVQTKADQSQKWRSVLAPLLETDIVTNIPTLSARLPELYNNKTIYLVIQRQRSLYRWIETAWAQGIREFVFIGDYRFSEQDLSFFEPVGARLVAVETQPLEDSFALTRFVLEPELEQPLVVLREIVSGLETPTYLTAPDDGSNRLFVLEKPGRIRVIQAGQLLAQPFLDITDLVVQDGNEQGILSMVFEPEYAQSGRFWVSYSTETEVMIVRYQVSEDPNRADPTSAQIILKIGHPDSVHYGGQMQFGPDGYLYLSVGDGGYGEGTPALNGQRQNVLLGKLLRLDVTGETYEIPPDNPFVGQPDVRPEIWAYGFRNPWRFSFDRLTHDLYISDVGEADIEEINFQPAQSKGGENYGWNLYEGTQKNTDSPTTGFTWPIFEVTHEVGFCALIGGYVYRGALIPELQGNYLFSDYCTGQIWAFSQNGSAALELHKLFDTPYRVTSFGEDASGEVYVLDASGGVYRLEPATK